ncbi:hypothetical protein F441_11935 [Phytophthora nicotianae CJ01A1]|uniref:Uncharacterized protein n=4 Tax=Phytophthora nicotianae TaxID=4792 RepID=W2Q398_PHYN3|nr:hypothetical protein PPTG_23347 [Phytophthora nicotianae INRA-310]ETI42984.1 hypothetical protein F443_11979 [Phytophthora nicotianae P1569]ETK83025.1 hypothetical protein L915_11687 [Phytophthora nicotianae]ETP12739.1 hypothetical protein F441_11935 [Phytophthora nicotianae CJ01A1]ETL36406.1 hypothetical protein L916_11611 [Phytophthora nicotianae]ETM42902.1 hypothetical protein L914_11524 [Phytophthora nicotianae]
MDEFHTSKPYSGCHERLLSARLMMEDRGSLQLSSGDCETKIVIGKTIA